MIWVHLCVLTLGFSRRLNVEPFPHERRNNWFVALEGAFANFGGVPEKLLVANTTTCIRARWSLEWHWSRQAGDYLITAGSYHTFLIPVAAITAVGTGPVLGAVPVRQGGRGGLLSRHSEPHGVERRGSPRRRVSYCATHIARV